MSVPPSSGRSWMTNQQPDARAVLDRIRVTFDHPCALGDRDHDAPRRLGLVRLVDEEILLCRLGTGQLLLAALVEEVVGRARRRAALLEALGLLLGSQVDRLELPREEALGRVLLPGLADHVRFPVVEEELRGVSDLLDRPVGVLDIGKANRDLRLTDSRDLRLGDAEAVGAIADDLDRPVHVLRCHLGVLRGRPTLVDQLGTAAQIEAELRVFLEDDRERPRQEGTHERENDQVAATTAHQVRAAYSGVRTSSSPPSSS